MSQYKRGFDLSVLHLVVLVVRSGFFFSSLFKCFLCIILLCFVYCYSDAGFVFVASVGQVKYERKTYLGTLEPISHICRLDICAYIC